MPHWNRQRNEPGSHRKVERGPTAQPENVRLASAASGWKDTLAMMLAAYQALLPNLLATVGVMFVTFLLLRWAFS